MRFWCNKYVQSVNIIIKMNILRNVWLNKSYLYINVFYIFLSSYRELESFRSSTVPGHLCINFFCFSRMSKYTGTDLLMIQSFSQIY